MTAHQSSVSVPLCVTAAAALLLAAPAAAELASFQQSLQDGAAEAPGVRDSAIRRFVGKVTVQVDGQLPRYHVPLCTAVTGLKDDAALAIVSRLDAAAAQVGLGRGGAGCSPNLVVMVVDDARAAVRALQKQGSLAALTEEERRRVLASDGPAIAFSDTEVQNDDGQPLGARTSIALGGTSTGTRSMPTHNVRSVSILKAPTRQATLRTILVIEAKAFQGRSLAQIGDFAAMWGIGGVRRNVGDDIGAPTILALAGSGDSAPPGLTALDTAFLSAVYETAPNEAASVQRQKIAAKISEKLARR